MLDEKKIRVMTRLAAYEIGAGKKYMPIAHFFRGDYIALEILKSFISGTLAFVMILGFLALCNFEEILSGVYGVDLIEYVKGLGKNYLICMVIYLVATYVYAVVKYTKAKKSLNSYISVMDKFSEHYYE